MATILALDFAKARRRTTPARTIPYRASIFIFPGVRVSRTDGDVSASRAADEQGSRERGSQVPPDSRPRKTS